MPVADPLTTYLHDLHTIRASGAAVKETSYYGPLATLLNEVGAQLKPRVRCIIHLKNTGAGIPDGGLFSADQLQKNAATDMLSGPAPSRGVLEVKGTGDEVTKIAVSAQVRTYLAQYGQVLVTNYRDFVLVGQGASGQPLLLEQYRLAASEAAFWSASPSALAHVHAEPFAEYLKRVMLSNAPLTTPRDVAWFLASYARDAKARIEHVDLPTLTQVRQALEGALGITFAGDKGEHFFRSTLVQTLFYGLFSAWVLWHNENPARTDAFDWRTASYYLHVPVIQALFEQLVLPTKIKALNLSEVMAWTGAALNRVNRAAFFATFETDHAVQYFYEPFLDAFDPELRRDLGVWYTPPEIIEYMVARVDTVLRDELGIADGLADPNVFVLDPCCGTGAYLVAVLKHIAATLHAQGEDALLGAAVKQAALGRVFGFELLPAAFVIAHLQLGLLLQQRHAPLAEDGSERVSVYLTNALTGWEPPDVVKDRYIQQTLAGLPGLQEERDSAERIKRDVPILVVLGNPPYSGYAGIAQMDEERDLSRAYRTTKAAPAPQGQGLNDLYVRFFRMAERRIVDGTGQGIVCYISNYSWLDGLSFTAMRERYLEAFDTIWIDNLNGDKYKTGKLTPEGAPDPSVFSTAFNTEGIQVGTAIALMVRKTPHAAATLRFRNLWGSTKRADLLASATQDSTSVYQQVTPALALGLPFVPTNTDANYLAWPLLPELFSVSSPGVKTSRDLDLVEIDKQALERRMQHYFDPNVSNDAVRHIAPSLMSSSARYDAVSTRSLLMQKGLSSGAIVRYCYQPFDVRYVYWHRETKLLDEKRESLFGAFQAGNFFLASRQKGERLNEGTPFYITQHLPDWHMTRPGSICFPLTLNGWPRTQRDMFTPASETTSQANVSPLARKYLSDLGYDLDNDPVAHELLWFHALAIGYAPAYLAENADGIRQDWPRIPLPASAEALRASAALGRSVAALLDTERAVAGVTNGAIRPELLALGRLTQVTPNTLLNLAVSAGWGHGGNGNPVMPGRGKAVERALTTSEAVGALGIRTYDVYLNSDTYWTNIPASVWDYTIGGYQVIKKWLSYREQAVLGRALMIDEAREVTQIVRRVTAILLLEPQLDANYRAVTAAVYLWHNNAA